MGGGSRSVPLKLGFLCLGLCLLKQSLSGPSFSLSLLLLRLSPPNNTKIKKHKNSSAHPEEVSGQKQTTEVFLKRTEWGFFLIHFFFSKTNFACAADDREACTSFYNIIYFAHKQQG